MPVSALRLPTRFPVGTRFVIEGRAGGACTQYLEFPDGRHIDLPHKAGRRPPRRRRARPGATQK